MVLLELRGETITDRKILDLLEFSSLSPGIARFIVEWESANSLEEFVRKTGISKKVAIRRAIDIRRRQKKIRGAPLLKRYRSNKDELIEVNKLIFALRKYSQR